MGVHCWLGWYEVSAGGFRALSGMASFDLSSRDKAGENDVFWAQKKMPIHACGG